MKLKWTKRKPTKPGYYWIRFWECGRYVNPPVVVHYSELAYKIYHDECAGPIPEPKDK